jgi:hypothetical protein
MENGVADDPSQILQPYIDVILKLGRDAAQEPIFTAFYIENTGEITPHTEGDSQYASHDSWFIPPPVPLEPLGDIADTATRNAEIIFRSVLKNLDNDGEQFHQADAVNGGIWPQSTNVEEEEA